MKKIEVERGELPKEDIVLNIECALKSALYMHFRKLYNNIQKYGFDKSFATALFFFIRNYAYSGMFRYNAKGEFNVPYGGIGYNTKNLSLKANYFQSTELSRHLENTVFSKGDFEGFLERYQPTKEDFVFLDPPYDTEFSTYAQNEFTKKDQQRLANYLIEVCAAKWMMIIKNTDFISNLYLRKGLNVNIFDKKYLVSIKNRNEKSAQHLMITNYEY